MTTVRALWAPARPHVARAATLYRTAAAHADLLKPVALLAARLLVARVFLLSGLTKWNGFKVSGDAYYLFADEFFAKYDLPRGVTDALTVASAVGEVALPVLLIFGLASRASALGLLAMTTVIQVFVYPDAWWNVHAWWAAVLLVIVSVGPGAVSLDRLLGLEPAQGAERK
jgi:putative oxidoreductase